MAEREASPRLRRDVIAALRKGVVPETGLALIATGMERFARILDEELDDVAAGRGVFKVVRGEWGEGKTFFARWLEARAVERGFAASEVTISETETPLYKQEVVYRRALERLATPGTPRAAFRTVVDGWLFRIEEEMRAAGELPEEDSPDNAAKVEAALERRLATVGRTNPTFAAALRGYQRAVFAKDDALAEGLMAWLSGQPNVAAAVKREARVKGEIDSHTALSFLRGVLHVLREAGHKGLVLVLDEVETIQRQPRDLRARSLQALRELVDGIEGGAFPGLFVLVTGTPAFFDGRDGIAQLPPLEQRLKVSFSGDVARDNLRLPQVRLAPFDRGRLVEVGRRVRDLYPATDVASFRGRAGDGFVGALADAVAGKLGGKVGVAPRLYLRKLVDALDRVNDQPDFDPAREYALDLSPSELTPEERALAGIALAPGEARPGGTAPATHAGGPTRPDDVALPGIDG